MKSNIFFILSAVLLISFYSCGNSSNHSHTHTHADGTVHDGAEHIHHEATATQESFTIEEDGSSTIHNSHECDHLDHQH